MLLEPHELFQIQIAKMGKMSRSLGLLVTVTMGLARATPKIPSARWDLIDCAFNDLVGPLHWEISNEEISTDVAAEQIGMILARKRRQGLR